MAEDGLQVVSIQPRDEVDADLLGTRGHALAVVAAGTEPLRFHHLDHAQHALGALRLALRQEAEVRHLRRHEQHGGRVGAGGDARATSDALCGVHGAIGSTLRDGDGVGLGGAAGAHGDEPTGLDHAIERAAVHHEVFDDGKGPRAPRLCPQLDAIREVAHMELTGRGGLARAVRPAVDHHAAGPADPLTAIVVEGDRLLVAPEELLVQEIEHLEEGHVSAHVRELVTPEPSGGGGARLAPDMQREAHYL